jgi:hypothetical protein
MNLVETDPLPYAVALGVLLYFGIRTLIGWCLWQMEQHAAVKEEWELWETFA